MLAAVRSDMARAWASSSPSASSAKARETLASMTNMPPPGSLTMKSGRCWRPSSVAEEFCSSKSKRPAMPAASSTLRQVCSPQRPRRPVLPFSASVRRRASSRVAVEAAISRLSCSFSPPVSSARAFSSAVTCSWNLARVSETGLSWASIRSRATRSWAWKVSVARATSLVATASADWAAWALRNSAMESRLSSISASRASAASSAPRAFCQPI
ncbi:hypothetical protein D3C77_289790 [compost metagenome]